MVRTLWQRAWVQSLGQGTKILQAMQCGKKKKKKSQMQIVYIHVLIHILYSHHHTQTNQHIPSLHIVIFLFFLS